MTTLDSFNITEGAYTLLFDERKSSDPEFNGSSEAIRAWMETLFDETEASYDAGAAPRGHDLFRLVDEKRRNGEAILTGKMVIGYYLDLEDLDDVWIDGFLNGAVNFRKSAPTANPGDYQYIIFLHYRVNSLDESSHDRISRCIARLALEQPENEYVVRKVYMLRVSGFDDFNSEEKAMVQMMYLLSRSDYARLRSLAISHSDSLGLLNSIDYYENRAINCEKQIEEIRCWEQDENDPGQTRLIGAARTLVEHAVGKLQAAQTSFKRMARLYPVRIDQFEGNLITGYHSKLSPNNPRLRQRRQEYLADKKQAVIEEADVSEIEKLIREQYYCKDLNGLADKLADGSLKNELSISTAGADESDNAEIITAIIERIQRIAEAEIAMIDERKNEKRRQARMLNIELISAGRYKDLRECFRNIRKDLTPAPVNGYFPLETNVVALIQGKPSDNWMSAGYEIEGVDTAYRCIKIAPSEIMLLIEYDMVRLNDADVLERLNTLY